MEAARHALLSLPYADMVGQEVALASAQNYRTLRRWGVTAPKTIDVIIATFCISHVRCKTRGPQASLYSCDLNDRYRVAGPQPPMARTASISVDGRT